MVEKETVPVERVRLEKDTVTDDLTVDEEVRKETSKPTQTAKPADKNTEIHGSP